MNVIIMYARIVYRSDFCPWLQFRVRPEDVIINIGKDATTPKPNVPGKWKAVKHDQTVTWLANWTENVNEAHKYVFLAAGSSLKGQSDMMKFEKARELKVGSSMHSAQHLLTLSTLETRRAYPCRLSCGVEDEAHGGSPAGYSDVLHRLPCTSSW